MIGDFLVLGDGGDGDEEVNYGDADDETPAI